MKTQRILLNIVYHTFIFQISYSPFKISVIVTIQSIKHRRIVRRQTEISKLVGDGKRLASNSGKTSRVQGTLWLRWIADDHKLYLVAATNNDSRACTQFLYPNDPFIRPIFIDSSAHQLALLSFRYSCPSIDSLFFYSTSLFVLLPFPLRLFVPRASSINRGALNSISGTDFSSFPLPQICPALSFRSRFKFTRRFILQIRVLADNPVALDYTTSRADAF